MTRVLIEERDGPVVRLRLNDPDRLNPLGEALREELGAAFDSLGRDPSVTVVVIDGVGPAFSAGADLTAPRGAGGSWAERRHQSGAWQRLLDQLESLPQITVAAIHGHCIGGAALLAVCCDLRVGDANVQVRIPELAIGIPLTWGGVPRLAREIGLPLTRDLVMTGRVLDGAGALACGFVQRLAPAGELAAAVDVVVAKLLEMPAGPLQMTKSLTAALGRDRAGLAAWADADLLAWSYGEPEGREAAAAYLRRQAERRRARADPS